MTGWRRPRGVMLPKSRARPKGRYSEAHARKALDFIEALPHVKGREWVGKLIELEDWQRAILEDVFGTLNPDGTRQYRIVYIEIPKKNSKSTIAAAVALYLLFADEEPGAEVYSAAQDREQATIVFGIAEQMVRKTSALGKLAVIRDYRKTIHVPGSASFYRAVERDAASQHGYNVHGLIFDEFHTQRTSELYNTLKEGTASRAQPLIFIITTAGFDRESICWKLHQYAKGVLRGTVDDPTFYPVIYSAVRDDEDATELDWLDEKLWKKANPALGAFLPIHQMRASARQAAEIPSEQNEFKRLRLNIWTQHQMSAWIPVERWAECESSFTEADLLGRECFGGLDLGAVSDLTAWALVFPDDDGVDVLVRAWCPESRLYSQENIYRNSYQEWAREGWLIATEGDATDYAFVRRQILEDAERFKLIDLGIDRYFQAHHISQELMAEGLTVVGMSQTAKDMAAATRDFEERVRSRTISHNGNPLLSWSLDNVALQFDVNGNMKPSKKESEGKIDPIIALIMALDRCMRHEPVQEFKSVYRERGLVIL